MTTFIVVCGIIAIGTVIGILLDILLDIMGV